jgi:hypothetical protein
MADTALILAKNLSHCGFGTSAWGRKVDAKIAWAKLHSLVEGALLASAELW